MIHTHVHNSILIATKTWERPGHPLTDEWIRKVGIDIQGTPLSLAKDGNCDMLPLGQLLRALG